MDIGIGSATATDLFPVTITSNAPASFPIGATTVIWTATDANGNTSTATQVVTVTYTPPADITAPVVTAPAAITIEATGINTTVTLGTATATDAVDGAIVPTSDAPASFPVGVTTVTYTATDAAGNIGTATQIVTVTDTTVPVIIAPAAVTADSINGGDPTITLGTATATDLFAVTITNNAPAIFSVGVTTVVWTATDANGNASAATQLVTVNLIDTLPPVITVPANVYTSTSTSQATVDVGIASANDNIDGIVAVTNNAPATFPVGVTAVIYTASDAAGNTATATQSIYVSYVPTVGGGSGGGGTIPPPAGGGATVGMEAVYWHHNDHLGTPQALTDINGTKVWEMSQTPFGIATVNEDPDGDGLLVVNNFRFPGQYYDSETGLNYNYFRTYFPGEGRYTQHDLIGLRGGSNPYRYVSNNPISNTDKTGLLENFTFGLNCKNMSTLVHIEGGVGYPAFSGASGARNDPNQTDKANYGALPKGRYYIIDRQTGGTLGGLQELVGYRSDWFALIADDGVIDDFTTVNGTVRSSFRLHAGGRSEGCITVANKSSYQLLRNVLLNTSTANIPGTNTKYYGIVTVK